MHLNERPSLQYSFCKEYPIIILYLLFIYSKILLYINILQNEYKLHMKICVVFTNRSYNAIFPFKTACLHFAIRLLCTVFLTRRWFACVLIGNPSTVWTQSRQTIPFKLLIFNHLYLILMNEDDIFAFFPGLPLIQRFAYWFAN